MSESPLDTLKCGPKFAHGIAASDQAVEFCSAFFPGQSRTHHHGALGPLTPATPPASALHGPDCPPGRWGGTTHRRVASLRHDGSRHLSQTTRPMGRRQESATQNGFHSVRPHFGSAEIRPADGLQMRVRNGLGRRSSSLTLRGLWSSAGEAENNRSAFARTAKATNRLPVDKVLCHAFAFSTTSEFTSFRRLFKYAMQWVIRSCSNFICSSCGSLSTSSTSLNSSMLIALPRM